MQCDREVVVVDKLGQAATPVAETLAFPSCPGTPAATCIEDPNTVCLGGGRFRAKMTWTDFTGETREASQAELAVPGLAKSSESGVFSFFDEGNWELLVKVLDGCAFNDRFWVFSTAMTNVEYDLRVTDTATGAVWTSHNPLGRISPAVTDTEAFAICPD